MFSFKSRINRKTYGARIVISLFFLIGSVKLGDFFAYDSGIILVELILFALWATFYICQIKQRANDIGTHPILVTTISLWPPIFLILGFLPGQKQSNKYGPSPK